MLQFPIITKEFSELLEQSEIDYMVSRVLAIKEREGNPMGVEVKKFGGATAFYVKEMPWGSFNTVKGIGSEDIGCVDDIIDFYCQRNRSFQFEIIPVKANTSLLSYLAEKCFYQSGFIPPYMEFLMRSCQRTRMASVFAKLRKMSSSSMENCIV
jgi:hypothetical protein